MNPGARQTRVAKKRNPLAIDPVVELSPREREIVRLVARGLSNKRIGAVLDISPWTVATHLRRLFAKCGVTARAALVATVLEREARTAERSKKA